jgi:anti-anti-sigma factor
MLATSTSPEVVSVVCDGCGRGVGALTTTTSAWATAWRLLTSRGWNGTPGTGGPHRCAGCTAKLELRRPDVPEPFRLPVHLYTVGEVTAVRPVGDLDAAVADDLRDLMHHLAESVTLLVLDLTAVHLIDSIVLGILVRAHQTVKRRGGLLYLAAPSRFVRAVLHTTSLERIFPAFDDVPTAAEVIATHGLARPARGPAA